MEYGTYNPKRLTESKDGDYASRANGRFATWVVEFFFCGKKLSILKRCFEAQSSILNDWTN